MKTLKSLLVAGALLLPTYAFAGGHATWTSVDDMSSIAFGSVKKDVLGEIHHLNSISGTVSEAGEVSMIIDLTSVETYIDIRNERVAEHVFANAPEAKLIGEIDMDGVSQMASGDIEIVDFEGVLSLAGQEVDIEAEMMVARLSDDKVLVTTADFIMLSTADLGIDAGIDVLQELAKLPSITRVTPVSVRMVFAK